MLALYTSTMDPMGHGVGHVRGRANHRRAAGENSASSGGHLASLLILQLVRPKRPR